MLKNETHTRTDKDGQQYEIEWAMVQVGTSHVLSVTTVDGKWLHYEIKGAHDTTLKPSDIEQYWLDRFLVVGTKKAIKKDEKS